MKRSDQVDLFTQTCFSCPATAALSRLQMYTRGRVISTQWRASAVKEPGHFEVRNILQPGHPDALFSSKKFTFFCSHYYRSKAIRRARHRAEPGLEPGHWICQPGHLTWRALDPGVAPPLFRPHKFTFPHAYFSQVQLMQKM